MNIDSNKIISIKKFLNNTVEVLESSVANGSLFIFDDNEPKYVLMSIEEYKIITKDIHEAYKNEDTDTNSEGITEILNSIGKKVFVNNYYVFKNDEAPEEKLPAEYTLNSRRSRSSKARKLFKENKNIEALRIILESDRIDDVIKSKALEIITDEVDDFESHYEVGFLSKQKIKVGKLARTTIISLIEGRKLKQEDIRLLLTIDYSKEMFNMNYPILRLANDSKPLLEQRKDSNGYSRYYSTSVSSYGKTYLICSQWVEELHRNKLEKWIQSKQ